jgi:pyruvate,water dikinase
MGGQGPGVDGGKLVVWLGDEGATDPAATGRKAASLARLLAAGFDVPDGFVLTTGATAAVVADGRIVEAVGEAIRAALAVMCDVPLAVRSSGVAEDLADASFAGQYETVLGVKGPQEVGRAIMTCLASASSPGVAAYRSGLATKGGEGESRAFAIIVQRLVPADGAGVAFTADPVTGDRDVVRISAVNGLADHLLSGASDAEEWVVRDDSPIAGRTSPPTPWPVTRPAETDPPGPQRARLSCAASST